jgi:hypothetical protein
MSEGGDRGDRMETSGNGWVLNIVGAKHSAEDLCIFGLIYDRMLRPHASEQTGAIAENRHVGMFGRCMGAEHRGMVGCCIAWGRSIRAGGCWFHWGIYRRMLRPYDVGKCGSLQKLICGNGWVSYTVGAKHSAEDLCIFGLIYDRMLRPHASEQTGAIAENQYAEMVGYLPQGRNCI